MKDLEKNMNVLSFGLSESISEGSKGFKNS